MEEIHPLRLMQHKFMPQCRGKCFLCLMGKVEKRTYSLRKRPQKDTQTPRFQRRKSKYVKICPSCKRRIPQDYFMKYTGCKCLFVCVCASCMERGVVYWKMDDEYPQKYEAYILPLNEQTENILDSSNDAEEIKSKLRKLALYTTPALIYW